MRMTPLAAVFAGVCVLATATAVHAQDDQVGQQGSVWNLGELAPGAYPSTVTAVNQSCPGEHDFQVTLQGEAADFIIIVGPTILTDIPPGAAKTSDVIFDLRSTSPGPHTEGAVAVRCVDCPVTCSQDYDILAVHLTVTGDGSTASVNTADVPETLWTGMDLTALDPTVVSRPEDEPAQPPLRWIRPEAFEQMTVVTDALDEGWASLDFVGTGRAAGNVFTMTVTRHADSPFEMGFRLGTLIVPNDDRFSPIMVADDGAVALVELQTTVSVPGYLLDPTRAQPPIDGADAVEWTVSPPPDSGQFADAMSFINAGYALAGEFSTEVPVSNYLQVVVQRTIWAESAPDDFNEERLQMDIVAQAIALGKVAEPQQAEAAAEDIWGDLSKVANLGKSR